MFQILGSGLSASSYYDLVYHASLVDEGPSHGKGGWRIWQVMRNPLDF